MDRKSRLRCSQGAIPFGYDPNVCPRDGTQPQLVGLWHVVLRLPQRHDVGPQARSRDMNLPYIPDAGPSCGANYISPPTDETGADVAGPLLKATSTANRSPIPNPPSGW